MKWKLKEMDEYVCKNCDQMFKAYDGAEVCPYGCRGGSIFNISFEERMMSNENSDQS